MWIDRLDHLVLTVADVAGSCEFYRRTLGFEPRQFGGGRWALHAGRMKINLHDKAAPVAPHAKRPVAGSADLCFVTKRSLARLAKHLQTEGVVILEGPVPRTGALGPMTSLYFRDPDGNLIEVSRYA